MICRDKDEASLGQHPGLQCDIALISSLPSTSVDPKHDWQVLLSWVLRSVDIENVAFVPVLHVGNVRRQSLRSSIGTKEDKRENKGGNQPEIHEMILFDCRIGSNTPPRRS